ncbi:MAG: hypothetical protein WBX05_08425, partial [Pseudolabrys sp.]
ALLTLRCARDTFSFFTQLAWSESREADQTPRARIACRTASGARQWQCPVSRAQRSTLTSPVIPAKAGIQHFAQRTRFPLELVPA